MLKQGATASISNIFNSLFYPVENRVTINESGISGVRKDHTLEIDDGHESLLKWMGIRRIKSSFQKNRNTFLYTSCHYFMVFFFFF